VTVSLGVGVIGAGLMGTVHVGTLTAAVDGAHVAAVSDVDAGRAAEAAQLAGGARVLSDPLGLIGDPEVDAVIVASFDTTHEPFVLACLQAGKPVLCEKPLATSAEACRRVIDAEIAVGRRLVSLGFMRRYDPGYASIKASLDAGGVGRPLMVHCAHRNATVAPGYTSEMLITSSVVHEIDVTRWLLGDEIISASVFTPRPTTRAANGLRDPQFVLLETEGGMLVDVEVFVNARYGYDIRCELVGETGTLTLDPQVAPSFRERFATAYRHELDAWVQSVNGGEPLGPSAWDGYAANAVADACLQSLASGERVAVRPARRPALYA
jgi:myo-inositol 2-dehydrogenase/D-chiro-inositol 1-dehydrogenase